MKDVYAIAGISKQALHQHTQRQMERRTLWSMLVAEVDTIREEHPGCGAEKMFGILKPKGIGRDRFCDKMMALGYRVVQHKNYLRTTRPACYQYQNLIEGMLLTDQDQIWQSDITYFKVGAEYYYLVFIVDVYTKQILGYRASNHMRASANLEALQMAIKARKMIPEGLIHHSDRGSQYGEKQYLTLLQHYNIQISMGKKATENAYAERINGIIKNEYLRYWEIKDLRTLRMKLKKAVDHYNTKRPHDNLSKSTPDLFAENLRTLCCQKRPTVIVYAEGNQKIKAASSRHNLSPEKTLRAHVCPIEIRE